MSTNSMENSAYGVLSPLSAHIHIHIDVFSRQTGNNQKKENHNTKTSFRFMSTVPYAVEKISSTAKCWTTYSYVERCVCEIKCFDYD